MVPRCEEPDGAHELGDVPEKRREIEEDRGLPSWVVPLPLLPPGGARKLAELPEGVLGQQGRDDRGAPHSREAQGRIRRQGVLQAHDALRGRGDAKCRGEGEDGCRREEGRLGLHKAGEASARSALQRSVHAIRQCRRKERVELDGVRLHVLGRRGTVHRGSEFNARSRRPKLQNVALCAGRNTTFAHAAKHTTVYKIRLQPNFRSSNV
jgi:hypothetical protein